MFNFNMSKFTKAWGYVFKSFDKDITIPEVTENFLKYIGVGPHESRDITSLSDFLYADNTVTDVYFTDPECTTIPDKSLYRCGTKTITIGGITRLESYNLCPSRCTKIVFTDITKLEYIADYGLNNITDDGDTEGIVTHNGKLELSNIYYVGIDAFSGMVNPNYPIVINKESGGVTIATDAFRFLDREITVDDTEIDINVPENITVCYAGFRDDPRSRVLLTAGNDIILGTENGEGKCVYISIYKECAGVYIGAFQGSDAKTFTIEAGNDVVIASRCFCCCGSIENVAVTCGNTTLIDTEAFRHCKSDNVNIKSRSLELGYNCFGVGSIKSVELSVANGVDIPYGCFSYAETPERRCLYSEGNYAPCDPQAEVVKVSRKWHIPGLEDEDLNLRSMHDTLKSLESVSIDCNDNPLSIGAWSFVGQSFYLDLPHVSYITSIGDHAFFQSTLKDSHLDINIQGTVGAYAFAEAAIAYVQLGGVEPTPDTPYEYTLGVGAFAKSVVQSVKLSEGLTSLDAGCFYGSSIPSIVIPDTATVVGDYAFANCTNLSTVEIGTGLTELSKYCFSNTALSSIDIPTNITTIKNRCFSDNPNLNQVTGASNVAILGSDVFTNTGFVTADHVLDTFAGATGGSGILSECSKLVSAKLSENVSVIPSRAFENSPNFNLLDLGEAQRDISIGAHALSGLSSDLLIRRPVTRDADSKKVSYPTMSFNQLALSPSGSNADQVNNINELIFYAGDRLPKSASAVSSDSKAGALSRTKIKALHCRLTENIIPENAGVYHYLKRVFDKGKGEWKYEWRTAHSTLDDFYTLSKEKPNGYPFNFKGPCRIHLGEEFYSLERDDGTVSGDVRYIYDSALGRNVASGNLLVGDSQSKGDSWGISFWGTGAFLVGPFCVLPTFDPDHNDINAPLNYAYTPGVIKYRTVDINIDSAADYATIKAITTAADESDIAVIKPLDFRWNSNSMHHYFLRSSNGLFDVFVDGLHFQRTTTPALEAYTYSPLTISGGAKLMDLSIFHKYVTDDEIAQLADKHKNTVTRLDVDEVITESCINMMNFEVTSEDPVFHGSITHSVGLWWTTNSAYYYDMSNSFVTMDPKFSDYYFWEVYRNYDRWWLHIYPKLGVKIPDDLYVVGNNILGSFTYVINSEEVKTVPIEASGYSYEV